MGAVIRISMQMLFKLSTIIPYLNYSFLSSSSTFQPKHNPHQIGSAASKLTNPNCDKIREMEFMQLEILERAPASFSGANKGSVLWVKHLRKSVLCHV